MADVELLPVPRSTSVVVAYLKAQYASLGESASVSTKIRSPRPLRFTRVRLMGGTRSFVVRYAPMVTFECWAETDVAAEDLAVRTEALVEAMPDRLDACTRVVNVGGIAYQPDPDTAVDRYVFTNQIYLRSTAA